MLVLYFLLFCTSTFAYVQPPPNLYDLEDAENIFEEFIKKHNKVYATEEEKQKRFEIFKQNVEKINNLRMSESGKQASFDLYHFSDWTQAEFRSRYLGLKPAPHSIPPEPVTVRDDLPESYDWRDHNAVTAIKDQEGCGSCWAFSTTGTIEGAYAIKYKELLSFSEQQLVECAIEDDGCGGGFMNHALSYLQSLGGIALESDYPYRNKDDLCGFDTKLIKAHITGQKAIQFGDDEKTKQALIDNGPISISVYADDGFLGYRGGIHLCPSGTNATINHGVLLVGYGTAEGKPYWLIKNQWNVIWGEKGYIRVQMGNNPCGMDYNGGIVAVVA